MSSATVVPGGDKVDGSFDFEKALRDTARRRGEAQMEPRTLGVMFRNLRVVGLGATVSYQSTLGSIINPLNILRAIQDIRHPPVRDIIHGFEGTVRPGEMLLVLGRPGSGCTTLLKTLANQREEYHTVGGEVHYDSISPEDIRKHFRGDVQYCPEDDVHFPTLTVNQTIEFAGKTRVPQTRAGQTRQEYTKQLTDMLISVFGLTHVRDTSVGNVAIRGISGGERKRVSIAETLAMRSCITAWDNSTRGLDSSTALEFVRALRVSTDISRLTSIMCLYQAGEPLYQLFDKVCVLYEGRMAYFGPAIQAKQYFIDMGYEPAHRQTTADFLVSVTDPMGRIPRAGVASLPQSASEFATSFSKSKSGVANRVDTDSCLLEYVSNRERALAFKESAQEEHAKCSRRASPYVISIPMQIHAVVLRRVQIIKGNPLAAGITFASYIIKSLVVGSVFLNLPDTTSAYYSRAGVLFYALLTAVITNLGEIPSLYAQRPIVLRHKKSALYHPFVDSLARTLVDVPIACITHLVSSLILYFMVGLQQSADQFFTFVLFMLVISLGLQAWIRAIAAATSALATAQSVGGISVIIMGLYTGYTLPKPSLVSALRWIMDINPLRYAFEGMLTNEFRTLKSSCSDLVPRGPGYESVNVTNQVCSTVGALPGQSFVDGRRFVQMSFGYTFSNIWRDLGILVTFTVTCVIIFLVLTESNAASSFQPSIVTFKRGSKPPVIATTSLDKEKLNNATDQANYHTVKVASQKHTVPAMSNVFSWHHLDYAILAPGHEERKLLSNISGYVAPGKLTALMGESGAGKTTLLDVLAQRNDIGTVKGNMFVNGQPLLEDFQSHVGYCPQMDTHLSTATVREALLFSAKLRQSGSVPLAEKEAYVERCLVLCGLEAYGNATVGSLSIELRKRTTIGVELAAKPKLLLFLDEPTSGLDTQSAWSIVRLLKDLADSGQAILCTIHQPSAELFQVFDRVLLLRKGGQTVYFGDLGHNATTIIEYFERNGSRQCLSGENPAEFMLDVIGAGSTSTATQDWHQIWNTSLEASRLQQELARIPLNSDSCTKHPVESSSRSGFATSWTYQLFQIFQRDAEARWRDPAYLVGKLILNVAGGLFVGFTFFKADDSQQGTQDKLFAVFMATILGSGLANQLQVKFIEIRSIYEIRERSCRMYSWTALIASQLIVELLWNYLGSSVFFVCWYWTVGFDSLRAGYTFIMQAFIFPLFYTTFGQFVAAMTPTAEVASQLFSIFFALVMIFDGVFQPFNALGWWQWMYRLSPYTYLTEGLAGQIIGHRAVHCSAIEFVSLNPPSGLTCGQYLEAFVSSTGGYLINPDAFSSCQYCSVHSTDQLLANKFNIYYDHHWRDFVFMLVFVIFNIFCLFCFMYLFRIRTRSLRQDIKEFISRQAGLSSPSANPASCSSVTRPSLGVSSATFYAKQEYGPLWEANFKAGVLYPGETIPLANLGQ